MRFILFPFLKCFTCSCECKKKILLFFLKKLLSPTENAAPERPRQ